MIHKGVIFLPNMPMYIGLLIISEITFSFFSY